MPSEATKTKTDTAVDVNDIRELLSSFLSDHQYNVEAAANAEETDALLAKKNLI